MGAEDGLELGRVGREEIQRVGDFGRQAVRRGDGSRVQVDSPGVKAPLAGGLQEFTPSAADIQQPRAGGKVL